MQQSVCSCWILHLEIEGLVPPTPSYRRLEVKGIENRMLLWRRRPIGNEKSKKEEEKTAAAEVAAAAPVVFSTCVYVCVCVLLCISPPLCESVCAAVINSSV